METQTQHREAVETAAALQNTSFAGQGIFRKEGEYWTVGYGNRALRLKDTKGFAFLAHLLRHPSTEFHVLGLAGGVAGGQPEADETSRSGNGLPRGEEDLERAGIHITGLGDAGEMVDDQAKVAYRRRLSELRKELEQAKELGNLERAERAEAEIDALTGELSRALGLGGRSRRAASASERARQSITKTIKSVLERIAEADAVLGEIFSRCIRTGTFCSYQPHPDFPIAWEFAAMDAGLTNELREQPASGAAPDSQASSPALSVSQFSFAERTAFVGRESERGTIRAAIDRALSGHGSVAMLAGGPGVGKTRLAMEIADYASSLGFRCLVGHCYERDEPVPYLPFAEIIESGLAQAPSLDSFRLQMGNDAAELAQIAPSLRRIFPDIPQPLDLPTEQRRRYLFQSLSEAVARSAAQVQPLLFILDDLHWADESSLLLLIHLARRVSQFPLVIIGTYRDEYSEKNPALVRTLEELIRMGVRSLKLGGLSRDAVAQMLNCLSQRQPPESLVSLIFEESQGYPFFVEEVYRHLIENGKVFDAARQFRTEIKIDETDVPENVRLIIGRRLERFDENEKRVLTAAAVIGRNFSFKLLTAICTVEVDELFTVIEKAQQMGIIASSSQEPETPFTFAHELVRQTLLAGISAPRQQLLHARVANAIEQLDADTANERAGEIADHLLKAGSFADEKKLVRNLTLAGNSALDAAAFEEALSSIRTALSHQGAVDLKERAILLASLARAERGLERWDAAFDHLREALEIYINLGDREMTGRSFAELTDAFMVANRVVEATETARRGLAYLQQDVSPDRARLLATLGEALGASAAYQPAQEALREGMNLASKLSDPKLEARLLGSRSIVNSEFFQLREAVADGFRSEQLGGLDASPWQRGVQLLVLQQNLVYLGRLEEALRVAAQLELLASKIGQSYSVALCLCTKAWAEFCKAPDLAKLETALRHALKSDQRARFAFSDVLSEVHLSLVNFLRGNWADAQSHARASCGPEPVSAVQGFGVGTLFLQLAYAGDHNGAFSVLDERRTWLPSSGQNNTMGSWRMLGFAIEGLAMLGEKSQAAQFYPLVRELIDTGAVVLWPIFRFTQTIAGVSAAAAQEWEAAEDHFKIALQHARSFPDRLEPAEIRRFHAMMLMDRGAPSDRKKAHSLLGEALETYTRIGMPRHIEMTQAHLDQLTVA